MVEQLQFRIHGMDCADEVAILRSALEPLVASSDRLGFDVLRGKLTVAPGTPPVDRSQVLAAVESTGMRAEPWQEASEGTSHSGTRMNRVALTTASGLLAAAAFSFHAIRFGLAAAVGSDGVPSEPGAPLVAVLLYLAAIVAGGWFILPRAWFAARRLRPDMNLLMTIAVIGALMIGEWFEAATVTFLFSVSLALESWSVTRARRAVEALLAIAPPTARLVSDDGTVAEVPAEAVVVGARLLVKPGDRIPLDGIVRRGASHVNQAPITGESLPVEKLLNGEVFAGTINGEGSLEIEVTRASRDTTLAQIIRMVGEAQARRAPAEQWVERFARVYTPSILLAAVLVAIVPPLAGGVWGDWLYRALVLLVIGCPCALVISTPVSIVASLASAARNGVLVKGGVFVEVPARLRAVAVDKTGTLTEGAPAVVDVIPLDGHDKTDLLRVLGAIETHSDHPLARAIVAHVEAAGVRPPAAEHVRAVTGRGMTALVDGRSYWIGSHRFLEERAQETAAVHDRLEAMADEGHSVVVIGTDDHVCGLVTLADRLRIGSRGAVEALRSAGVEHVVMLTGDSRPTAERIAEESSITEFRAELLPADKVAAVEALVRQYGAVAMVGDGVNDAPAMGQATIGVAMGAAGSDAAIEAADVALMSDDLSKLAWLVRHSRRTLGIIRQNVAASIGVKAAFVGLTFTGHATLWAAIAADMGVSLVVIANALRLLGREDGAGAMRKAAAEST